MISKSPLDGYVLFLDRNFGRYQVADALRQRGLRVEVHQDYFPQADQGEESDEYWIREVTRRGWIILTRNGRIRNNPLERQTFLDCGARVFNIRNGNATANEVGECLIRATRRMARILEKNIGPFIVGISLSGEVTFIDPASG